MNTSITRLLNIRHPILCGPMLWLAEPRLCAAVSNAGGLGNITAANYDDGEGLRSAIQHTRTLTDKPFGVNITLLPSFRITPETYDDYFRVCAEEKVTVVDVSGSPAKKYIGQMHKAGVLMMHKVGSVHHAKNIEKLGYDAVIALGFEAGGHPHSDDVATSILTPRIADSVGIPAITAGGIVDGRGLAAALCLGASAVMMATRFIVTKECFAHANVKQEFINRQEHETTLICKSLALQGRALKNALAQKVLDIEKEGGPAERIYPLITGLRTRECFQNGNVEEATLMIGQSIGLIHDIPGCRELIERTMQQAEGTITRTFACLDRL